MEIAASTPVEFAKFLKNDRANAAQVYETLGIKPKEASSF